MASIIKNKRRTKLITPSNSSFSNCVQDQLFIQPLRRPLETFKPVVYLDEQGRRHGRVSDHLLQRQIEIDRLKLKQQPIPKVSVSSTLYGIRNPNIAALIKDVPVENDDDDEDELRADDEVKFIEYKKLPKPATLKSGARRISTVSGKQSVKFDTTPSVNMARLVDSHLTELDDIDNVDDGDDDDDSDNEDDEEDLESVKHSHRDTNDRTRTDKSGYIYSETPSTPKNNNDEDDGIPSNSTLEYNRQSQELQMPPTVEDVVDVEEEEEEEEGEIQQKQSESENDLSSPEIIQRKKQSTNSSERIEERQKSSSLSRPKTASTRSHTDNEEPKSSRASSSATTSSDNTSALLRSDNDNSQNLSDNELNNEEEEEQQQQQQIPLETPIPSNHTNSYISDIMNIAEQENISSQSMDKMLQQNIKGEYDPNQVIQLKESFQPIINEAASYGHLDIVRKLIECGQSVHTQNLLQRTPLHEACVSGNEKLVSELLNSGALIDQKDSQGMTPLHVAATHGTVKCIRILCEKGCDINAQDNLGQTAAHYSAMHNHVEVLKYLITVKHINLSISNNDSKLSIHYAAKHGSKNVLNLFFQLNLLINATDCHGNMITHEASEYNQLDCIKLIWKLNQNLFKKKNNIGRTSNHTAALFGSIDVLHWLLELNIIDIDQTDNNGYTMAHLAASRGHSECFSCLIMHGAQLDIYTFDRHESVLNLAKRSGKNVRIEQACSGIIRCHSCEEKLKKEKYDKTHSRNAVEQLIHTQIQRGYNLNIPVNRSFTTLSQRNRPTS